MAHEVVDTFYVAYLLSGNFSAGTVRELERKKSIFATKYTGWGEAEQWLSKTMAPHRAGKDAFDVPALTNMVVDIGEKYHQFNDLECQALKTELLTIESKKQGRIRLSQFY